MKKPVVILFCMMMSASMLWPSEGAINGDGLHLTLLWLVTALVAVIVKLRDHGRPDNFTWNRTQLAGIGFVILLLVGFWLSTWNVFRVHGDRRAALNLTFEWSGIVAVFLIIGSRLRHQKSLQSVVALVIGLGLGTAILGIWQHHISDAQRAEWYQQQRSELDTALQINDIQSSLKRSQLESDFERMKIPLNGSARQLFERRLLDSSEPVGPFALANTLGGVLSVAVVLLIAGVLHSLQRQVRISMFSWCLIGGIVFVLGYCLLLTKSRTAWVGCMVGIMFLIGRQRFGNSVAGLARIAVGASILVAATLGIGVATGAIDREVALEAPRSLQFRLLYWSGTAGVIRENPVFGSGPGNFRQIYLRHKTVESSEDILDPHNILLDTWCSAGLVGLIGLAGLLACCVSATKQFRIRDLRSEKRPQKISWPLVQGILAGTGLHLSWRWFNGADMWANGVGSENALLMVPVAACLVTPLIAQCLLFTQSAASAALICLVVHLLGAGGLQITVLGLFLVLLAALTIFGADQPISAVQQTADARTVRRMKTSCCVLAALFLLAAAALTTRFGLIPVRRSQQQLHMADVRKTRGDRNGTVDALNRATESDPYSVDSRQQLMQTLAYDFQRSVAQYAQTGREFPGNTLRESFDRVIESCNHLIDADRRAGTGYYSRSRVADLFRRVSGNDSGLLMDARRDLQRAVGCDPSNSELWFELADFQYEVGLFAEAATAALRATEIDAVNLSWGHVDQYLAAEKLERLKLIQQSGDSD
ncbi:MAG TPA: O-antigen ligase domain-containing protein [Planctomycetes bacterium]|nr:O-antigen ligase domain-containing protein [Planctomycetota bacterium]